VLEFSIPYLVVTAYLSIATSHHSFTLVLLSDILSILHLGRIVDDDGIRMDPDKVDSVVNWKTSTNRDLLHGFIGSAGYLADNIYKVRVPIGVLLAITGDNVPFKWTNTEQRAFEHVKQYV
jgi:hypothetical protein